MTSQQFTNHEAPSAVARSRWTHGFEKPPNIFVSVSNCTLRTGAGGRAGGRLTERGESGVGRGLCGLPLLLIVLFIVCLCWLMAQCYVRREKRLRQAQAGYTVNPSTQPYWLTKGAATVQDAHLPCTHTHTVAQLVITAYTMCTCLQMPAVYCMSVLTFRRTAVWVCLCVCVCVHVCVAWMALFCSHWAAIIARVCLACALRVGFIPLQPGWGSLLEQFSPYPKSFFPLPPCNNLYTHKAWAMPHASVCVSTLS